MIFSNLMIFSIQYFHRFKLHTNSDFMGDSNKDSFRIRMSPGTGTTVVWFSFQGMLVLHIVYPILNYN